MKPYDDRELRSLLTSEERPAPPPDLAARIKAEIPAAFTFAPPEAPASTSVRANGWRSGWLLAASLVTILGGVWLAGRTMTDVSVVDRVDTRVVPPVVTDVEDDARSDVPAARSTARDVAASLTRPAPRVASESVLPLVIAEEADPMLVEPSAVSGPSIAASARERQGVTPAPPEAAARRAVVAGEPVAQAETDTPGAFRAPIAESSVADAHLDTGSAPPGDPTAGSPDALGASASFQASTAGRPAILERSKRLVPLHGEPLRVATVSRPHSVFPLVVDASTYARVRRWVDGGVWPPPEVVRVNALVNHFDYGDAPPVDADVALRAEGTALPLDGGATGRILLRVGVRARMNDPDSTVPTVIATAARAWLAFNPAIVAHYRLLGDDDRDTAGDGRAVATTSALLGGHGVTALYEIELAPRVELDSGWGAELATLHLEWTTATGEVVTRSRRITGEDVAVDWDHAPASLRWSVLVSRLADVLRRGPEPAAGSRLREETERLSPMLLHHPGFVEFRELVAEVERLSR